MHKAFTILELLVVILLISILSVMVAQRLPDDHLRTAADQVISHIRYTQHLAMIDNKYDPEVEDWYKERWQIFFSKSSDTELGDAWAYTIFSDDFTHTGKPDPSEIAVNPEDHTKRLTGGYTSGASGIEYSDENATKALNIGRQYGIADVVFTNCGSTAKRIAFDSTGRPYHGDLSNATSPYDKLLTTQCQISLCLTSCNTAQEDEKITIAVEAETGYVHILR